MRRFSSIIAVLAALVPGAALAAGSVTSSSAVGVVTSLIGIINSTVPILVAFAILGFVWGLTRFVWNAGNEKRREEGRQIMIWGIIAFLIFLSIAGITGILQQTFGVGGNPTINPPSASPSSYGLQ